MPEFSLFPQPLLMALTLLLGLCVGSFLNVVALRFLSEEDIVVLPSHCPQCKTPLKVYDNIPVLSWLLLGGQCRSCKTPISVQYPLVEIATALLFCLTVWFFGVGWQTPFLLFLIANLIVIFITDLKESLIFQMNSLSLVPAGLLFNGLMLGPVKSTFPLDLGILVLHVPDALVSALIAVGVAFAFFEGMILFSQLVFGTDGFGHGDTHLMMGAGAFLGWPFTVLALMLGFVAQTVPAVPMLVYQWIRNRQYLSLISGGAAVMFAVGPLFFSALGLPPALRVVLTLAFVVGALVALIVFLRQVRTAQQFTYLPLGPALVLGILLTLFCGAPLLSAYQHYLATRY